MTNRAYQRLTGSLFIIGPALINIPFTLLIMNFDYPDILREGAGDILTKFHAGGSGLILTWLAFAWTGMPILAAIVLLRKLLEREDTPYLGMATVMGIIGGIAQIVGLLRWTFVVPALAATYTEGGASAAAKESAAVVFQAIHQYGGVVLGEHIGQSFTIIWMLLISAAMFKSSLFKPWLAWFGILTSLVYSLAQAQLLATVLPAFPVLPDADLYGSLLWLAWMVITGVFLLRRKA
jgi:hypothetical protein